MALATRKGVLDFSPIRRDDTDKENDVPVLSLTLFSKAPFVSFGTVKIGTSKSAVLRIDNPTDDTEVEVVVEKIASSKGFSVDHTAFTIEPEGSFGLTITWTPTEEGGVRELVIFHANGALKHQAVLLGRAEAPKKKKKTLWDSIKNKPRVQKMPGPRAKKVEPPFKMASNKTFQVSRNPQHKRDKARSPLASLNRGKPTRRSMSKICPSDDQYLHKPVKHRQHVVTSPERENVYNSLENSPVVLPVSAAHIRDTHDQDYLPQNKDLIKVLNKTLSPIGTPARLKQLMPRIELAESPAVKDTVNINNVLNNSPPLSLKDALALIESDLSPINSSAQEASSEFSDSLESRSGHCVKLNGDSPENVNEPRLTFFVSKKVVDDMINSKTVEKVKMFTSTTVTKSKVQPQTTSGRKVRKSRRRLLELTDSSSQSESRPGTPCLPVIDTGLTNYQNTPKNAIKEADTSIKNEQASKLKVSTVPFSPGLPAPTVLVNSPPTTEHCLLSTGSSSPLQPARIALTSPVHCGHTTTSKEDMFPIVSSQPLLASSPESFPIHLPVKGRKRKSDEFIKANVKSQQVKRSRVAVVKCEPNKELHEKRPSSQRPQHRPAGSVCSNSSLKTVKSATPAQAKQHIVKPTTRKAPSLKSSAQKSKIIAVAQSKLSFIKPSQTALPRHPMPFAAKNMFFDERWIEKQEHGFTWWINYVLTPDDFKVNTEVAKVNAVSLAMGSEVSVPKAPTKEELSFSTYTARQKLNRLRRSACKLFTSDSMVKAIQRLEVEVEAKRLLVRKDRHLWKDIGERQKVLNWLLTYNPLWLRIGLETIYGELISLENNGDTFGLAMFILQRLLWNPDIAAEFRHSKVPHLYRDGHEEALSRFTLKKLLLLVCFLDKAKESRLIEHDPCLFCMDAEFKTSKDMLLAFSRDFLSGEGILPRHLGFLGLPVSHEQKPLDEFNFAVKNLAVDLKCGIRLVRVMELLIQDWSLSAKLRLPAISRLQKVHNVDIALQVLKKRAVELKDEHGSVIDSRDIVDGHREKTLSLLWKIIFAFHVEVILNEEQLKDEIGFLRKTLSTKRRLEALRADRGLQPSPAKDEAPFDHSRPKIRLLMDWVRAACDFYNIKVQNFTVSFSDGRVLCCLIHHYHPSLVPRQSIRLSTTQTVESSHRGRLELDCSYSDSDASFDSSPVVSNAADSPFKELLENEKHNFRLVNSAVAFLGGVPAMINSADMSNTIPNEKVVMSYLSFLCARLLDLRNETRAARVIQDAWRKYRLKKDLQLYQKRNGAALKIQSLVRRFLQRRRAVRQSQAAILIQAAWRGHRNRQQIRRQKEAQIRFQQTKAAIIIQAQWRMYSAIRSYQRLRYYTIVVQAQWRMRIASVKYARVLSAVSVIQKCTRVWSKAKKQRESYLSLKSAAVQIQRGYRRWKAQKTTQQNDAARVIQAAFKKWFNRKMSEKMAAAVKIQSWFRTQLCVVQYRQIRRCAVLIQAQYRGYVQRQCYQRLKLHYRSATVIQTAFRGYIVRKRITKMNSAAVVIQQHFRATVKTKAERTAFVTKRNAAIALQAAYRGKLARGALKRLHRAATVIQTSFRRYTAQKRYLLLSKATILIQQKYRARRLANNTKSDYVALRNATVKMQAVWRGRVERRKLETQNRRATVIQALYRRHVAQKDYKSLKASAIVIQQHFRAYLDGKDVRKSFLDTRNAAITLQAAFRGMQVRKALKKMHEAATVVQSYARMMSQQKRYRLLQSAVIVVQSRYRALINGRKQQQEYMRLQEATLKIQAILRGFLVRKDLKKQRDAATLIQASFRMHRMRMMYLATKSAAIIVQDRFRAKRMRDQQVRMYRNMKCAAITIQAAYRGHKTRKQIEHMQRASTKIQRAYLAYQARNRFVALRKAVLVCQSRYRAVKMARIQRCDYLLKYKAVLCLQSAFRGYLVRKELCERHTAAIVIQSHFRKYQLQTHYNELRWAAGVLQARFRANRKMKGEMRALQVRRSSVIVLQAAFRGLRTRRLLKKRTEAAVVIQRAFRTYCQHQQYLALKLAATLIQQRYRASTEAKMQRTQYLQLRQSVVVLQAAFRGHQVRKEVARWHQAATLIQSAYRKHREVVKYQAMRLSAITIQRHYRSLIVHRQERNRFIKVKESTIVLQAAVRGWQVRKYIANQRRAAVVIQSQWKCFVQRRRFMEKREAAWKLQHRFRAVQLGKRQRDDYNNQRRAARTLQMHWRAWITGRKVLEAAQAERRRRFTAAIFFHLNAIKIQRALRVHWALLSAKKQINSVITIQRWVRAWIQKRRYQEDKVKVVLAQRAVKRWLERRQKAACVLQRAARNFLLIRRQIRVQRGIVKAQALWRGYRSRRLNDNPKVVKLRQRLREVSAGVREEDKLCNKTTTALDYLLRYKHFLYILEALKNLEIATRLSPECCERLVDSGATTIIFTLIRCCNRSVPCMEVITYSIQVLLNLSKYHKTVEAVYFVDSSVETLLDLLQRYREKAGDKVAEKGGSIFTKACFLLALLLQDKPRAMEVMKMAKARDRIQSIYRLTARKHKMDAERTVVKQKMNASINGSFFIQATPLKARPAPKFAPDWVLQKGKLKDIVDPLRAIQMVAETLSIVL